MKTKSSLHTPRILVLVILFIIPALACSLGLNNLSNTNSDNKETSLASAVNATLTANAVTQAAQAPATLSPASTLPPPPTLAPQPVPTDTLASNNPPLEAGTATTTGPWIGDITFATGVTADNQAIGASTVFKHGVTEIYAIFPYSGIEQGKKITYYWTVNGKEFVSVVKTWAWDSSGTHPTSVGYSDNSQLDSGNWKLAIFYNNKLLASGTFKITY